MAAALCLLWPEKPWFAGAPLAGGIPLCESPQQTFPPAASQEDGMLEVTPLHPGKYHHVDFARLKSRNIKLSLYTLIVLYLLG